MKNIFRGSHLNPPPPPTRPPKFIFFMDFWGVSNNHCENIFRGNNLKTPSKSHEKTLLEVVVRKPPEKVQIFMTFVGFSKIASQFAPQFLKTL